MSPGSVGRTLLFLLFLGLPAPAAEPDFDPAALQERVRQLRPVVEDILGESLGKPVSISITTEKELEEMVTAEMTELRGAVEGGARGEELRKACGREAGLMSRLVLGKVGLDADRLLVCPPNFRRIAEFDPAWKGVLSQEYLDLVLLHELVHVHQQRRYGLRRFFGKPTTLEWIQVRQCVLEGHAQYVARRAARRLGHDDAFRLFVATQTEVPPGVEDAGTRHLMEVIQAMASSTYVDGEKFVTAIVKEFDYPKAVARIFAEPPTSLAQVSRPRDYLNPPAAGVDLDRIMARISRLLAERGKNPQTIAMTAGTLRVALAPAGKAAVKKALEGLRAAKVVFVQQRKAGTPLAVVGVLQCTDADAARAMYDAEVSTSKKKDELFKGKESPTRILSARYGELRVGDATGILGTKEVQITQLGVRQIVEFAVLRDRELVFEFMYNVDPSELGRCRRLARRVHALARATPWAVKGAEATAAFVGALDDESWSTRWRAARNLARTKRTDATIEPALRRALQDADPDVRLAAWAGLAARKELTPAERVAFDRDEDWEVRVASLETESEDHVARLQRALGDPHAAVRRYALVQLKERGESDSVPWERLRAAIRDVNVGVRVAAIEALTWTRIQKLDATEFAVLILAALQDPHPHVRREAVEQLAHADPEVDGVVAGAVAALHDEAFVVRLDALSALADFGEHAAPAVPELIRLLDDSVLRDNAMRTLGKIGPPAKAAQPKLVAALEDTDRDIRYEAADALRRIGYPMKRLLPVFVDALKNAKSEYDRTTAAEVLAEAEARDHIPDLIRALDDPSDWVRRTVIEALADLGAREALPKLRRLTEDPSEAVQAAARKAVSRLGG
ncbi:MAG: HEAT repeat domain-containing protein [Planctomycetota bacterium]|jgi:HEAT repeat protein